MVNVLEKKLAPSVLSADFAILGEEVGRIEEAGAGLIHIDVMDGRFVPNITVGPVVMKSLVGRTSVPFDVHLMIVEPDKYISDFVTSQTEYITVHAEACTHLHRTLQNIKSFGIKSGVALNPATPLSCLEYILDEVDLVLLMSVDPGFSGQSFIPSAREKLKALKNLRERSGARFAIEMDGGIDASNIAGLAQSGCDIAVAGSAVFGTGDASAAVKELVGLMN